MFKRCQAYLDFYKSNQRIKGAGFVKWIINDCDATVIVQVNNAPVFSRLDFPVYILGTKFSLGDIKIDCKRGCFEKSYTLAYLEKNGIDPMEVAGVEIIVSTDAVMRAQWKENNLKIIQKSKETIKTEAVYDLKAEKKLSINDIFSDANEEAIKEIEINDNEVIKDPNQETKYQELTSPDTGGQYGVNTEATEKEKERWEAIIAVLPREDRYCADGRKEVISLTPKDMSLINHKYLNLTQNSFLLHGYYNYKKLLLAQHVLDGVIKYYLGVPGNYYDREIKLAKMFGFDLFEDEETMLKPQHVTSKTQSPGDFGYYWKEVEL